jgi:uncharacterized protein YoxC
MDLLLVGTAQTMVADTVVTLVARDRVALAADIAILTVAIALAALVLLLARNMMQWHSVVSELRLTVRQNLGPVSDRARSISDNVEFVTQALRSDVTRLNTSVKALTERLTQASNHMEARIEEFNALMEVVQGEAEDILLDTAATVKGVRAGARAIAQPYAAGRALEAAAARAPGAEEASDEAAPSEGTEDP